MKKVLVFPCGTEIGLEINRALKYNKDYEIIGASSMDDHGKYVYEKYYGNLPMIDEENIIEEINKIIVKEKIDFIYPAHDSVVLKFSKKKEELKAKVITSEYFTCDICRSKKRTYEYFSNIILVPKMYNKKDIKEIDFPLFLKPEIGQGSKGTKKLDNIEDLNYFYKDSSQLLLEYLPYEEYTVDCFTDFNGKLIYISSRERLRISNGISVGAKEVEDKKINEIAKKINDNLKFNGAWFFQLKKNNKHEYCLLEIAPRVAGTMEFQRGYGVNLPLLNIYNADNKSISIIKNKYNVILDRALCSKFKIDYQYKYVYIDLDDVLIQNKKVNYMVIAFLYKSLNESKKIILITRHKNDINKTLNNYHIDINIFDKIIHIKNDDEKSKFIIHKNSIFIDDSFRERKDVYNNLNIPVFDTNMIDILM